MSRIVPLINRPMMNINTETMYSSKPGSKGFFQMEKKVYEERDGEVVEDKYIKETIADGKMKVEGYDNGKPIFWVKELGKKVAKKKRTMKRKMMKRKTMKQAKKNRRISSKSK